MITKQDILNTSIIGELDNPTLGSEVGAETIRAVLDELSMEEKTTLCLYVRLSEGDFDGWWNELRDTGSNTVLDNDAPNDMTLGEWIDYLLSFNK